MLSFLRHVLILKILATNRWTEGQVGKFREYCYKISPTRLEIRIVLKSTTAFKPAWGIVLK